jgi:hypothetical protein
MLENVSVRRALGVAALVALVLAVAASLPSAVRPSAASAQITCNGVFYPDATACTSSAGIYRNGYFYADQAACPASAGVTCGGVYYANTSYCPETTTTYVPTTATALVPPSPPE